jgi:putative autoinducer-2 (AI-2) aldolase
MAYRAVQEGASGVDMGRNIFQSKFPIAMIQALSKVVHEATKPEEAFEVYEELAHTSQRGSR